jgi:aldose 1-epimerase
MSRFTIGESTFGEFPTIKLNDTLTNASCEFSLRGAFLLSYHVPLANGLFNIIDGYETPQELFDKEGSRSMIMAPFSNRIDKGLYQFNNQNFSLKVANSRRNIVIHGFVGFLVFELVKMTADDTCAEVVFVNTAVRNGAFPGYPFDVDVEVSARLTVQGLSMQIAGVNLGNTAFPFGCGWHPYFKTSDSGIEHVKLMVPAKTAIAVTDRLIPLPEKDAFVPVSAAFDNGFDVSKGSELNCQVIDNAFTDLVPDADGIMRTRIEDSLSGIRITVSQKRGLMHVFTGDVLTIRPRKSIALEPVEFMTNAFARPDCADAIILKPKEKRTFECNVAVDMLT